MSLDLCLKQLHVVTGHNHSSLSSSAAYTFALVLLRHFPVRHFPVLHFPVLQIPVTRTNCSLYRCAYDVHNYDAQQHRAGQIISPLKNVVSRFNLLEISH